MSELTNPTADLAGFIRQCERAGYTTPYELAWLLVAAGWSKEASDA